MLIDLSHVGNRTSLDASVASVAPVAITHSNPTWIMENPRNRTDEAIRTVAEKGGFWADACTHWSLAGRKPPCRASAR